MRQEGAIDPLPAPLSAASDTPLVGRDGELRLLLEGIEGARNSGGGLVLVVGEPGIGKTRLLAAAAARTVEHRPVLYGRCERDPIAPLAPFAEMLGRDDVTGVLRALPDESREHLGQLVPSLALQVRRSWATEDPETGRLALFEAVTAGLLLLDGVLMLDDVHWAQDSTLGLLRFMVARPGDRRPVIVAAAREPDPDRGTAWAEALDELLVRASVPTVSLGGLGLEATTDLAGALIGAEVPDAVASELRNQTSGNPFFLRATIGDLRARGELLDARGEVRADVAQAARAGAPEQVASTVLRRARRLGRDAAALLETAALVGHEFSLEEARLATGLSMEEAVDVADAATAAGLVHDLPRPGTLAFDHAIVRQALADSLSPSRRALLHRRVANTIEEGPGASRRLEELARHFAQTIAFGGAEQALRYAREAAAHLMEHFAFAEAVAALELALSALDTLGPGRWIERFEVLMERGAAEYRSQGAPAAAGTFSVAADLAQEHHDAERLARAALGTGLERYLRRAGLPEQGAIELLERALNQLPSDDSALRAQLLSALALERCFVDPLADREALIDSAIAMAERLGDAGAALESRVVRQVVTWHPSRTEALLGGVAELTPIAQRQQRPDLLMHLHCTAVGYAAELSRRANFVEQLARAHAVAAELRAPIQRLRVLSLDIAAALSGGDVAAAPQAVARSAPEMLEIEPEAAQQLLGVWSFTLARERGGLAELRPVLDPIVAASPGAAVPRAMLAQVCAASGDLAAAHDHLVYLGRDGFGLIHDDFLWLGVMTMSAAVSALLVDRQRAAQLHDLLAPYADRTAIVGLAAFDSPVVHSLGLLARTLDRPREALEHFQAAVAVSRGFGSRLFESHALCECGATLLALKRSEEARDDLRAALDLADRCGATLLAERARSALLTAGARPRRNRLDGMESLTASEHRVARLAAAGLTNRDIAESLVVARRTVETHLTSVYRKLGIMSREELVDVGLAEGRADREPVR